MKRVENMEILKALANELQELGVEIFTTKMRLSVLVLL